VLACSSPPSDTVIPHICLIPGMARCHLGGGCRQRRATGGPFSSSFRYWSSDLGQLAFRVMVGAALPFPARRVSAAGS
jgi:hypothetical protein